MELPLYLQTVTEQDRVVPSLISAGGKGHWTSSHPVCLIIQEEETEVPSPPALPCCQAGRGAESPAHAE